MSKKGRKNLVAHQQERQADDIVYTDPPREPEARRPPVETEVLGGKVIQDPDKMGLAPRPTEPRTITDATEVSPMAEIPLYQARRPSTPPSERKVIYTENVEAQPTRPPEPRETSEVMVTDADTLRERGGTTSEWREAYRRPKKGEKRIIRG